MAVLTVRNVSDEVKQRLRMRAAANRRSMEEEVRHILNEVLGNAEMPAANLADAVRRHFAPLGGVELELPPRGPGRPPPRFDE